MTTADTRPGLFAAVGAALDAAQRPAHPATTDGTRPGLTEAVHSAYAAKETRP